MELFAGFPDPARPPSVLHWEHFKTEAKKMLHLTDEAFENLHIGALLDRTAAVVQWGQAITQQQVDLTGGAAAAASGPVSGPPRSKAPPILVRPPPPKHPFEIEKYTPWMLGQRESSRAPLKQRPGEAGLETLETPPMPIPPP
ncbi:unnamed protein product [Vitrella brassicaformis CCMP3155]|uniref:Uncharacterized protein n=1 Tax=Vitrella brassicaformis (strain CCMP3155) TaxID=1169540 RepID=A0A0G4GJS4_VITBC|nr:unnamed protein product [Vitrella brassicaformis CCMP3155]|eukprot:CEM30137.1 unnamed protein product [Vitrella brassicaformis CCMP3155]